MWSDEMSEVKVFRVTGKIVKPNFKTEFRKEYRALKPEEAVERAYKELGSRHRAKHFQISIVSVEPISPEEAEDIIIRTLSLGEKRTVSSGK